MKFLKSHKRRKNLPRQQWTNSEKLTQVLFKIANAVNTTDNLDELFESIHKSLENIVDAVNFYIALYDRKNDTISFPYNMDLRDGTLQEIRQAKKSSSLTNEVIQKEKALFFTKQEIISRAARMNMEVTGTPAELWLGVPLKTKTEVIGAIVIQSYDSATIYDQNDMDLLIAVSDQVALAINRKLAEDARNKSEAINKALFAISNAANTSLSLGDLYESIHNSLNKIMDLSNFYIALYNKEKDVLSFPYFIDEKDPLDSIRIIENVMDPLSPSTTAWVIQSGKPHLFNRDYLIAHMEKINKPFVGTPPSVWMGSPLKIKGQVIGAMVAQSYASKNLYDQHDLEIFNSVSDQVALAIERKRAQDAETESKTINKALFSISNAVNTTENLDELYISIHKTLGKIVDVTNFMIGIYNVEKDTISYSYYKDENNNDYSDVYNVSKAGILASEVINLKEPLFINKGQILEWADKKGFVITEAIPEQWLGIPLKIKKKVSGVIVVQSYSNPELYTKKDVEILISISDQIALAIDRKRSQEELRIAKEAAEASAESKSEFLANMSHEIRTPMNAIMGLTELILKTDLTLIQRDYLNKIKSSSTSLLGIINDILDFSKIDAGKMDIEKINFKLDDVLDSLSDMFSNKTAQKNIELIISMADDIPMNLVGDPLRLRQALINLTGNAVKFTDKGEVIVAVSKLEARGGSIKLKFTIKDTGIGIPEARLETLFDSFVQADGSTTRKYGGTGLGLSISKQLIELMGGAIDVKSTVGKGTQFDFYLPFKKKKMKPVKKKYLDTDLIGLKVLVVDDNKAARDIMHATLSSFHFNVKILDSGETIIQELIKADKTGKPYELIMLDLIMPGIDGIETAKRIRQNHTVSDIPIIMMTGFGREETMLEAKKANINAFLMKPVKQSILLDTIMDVFGKKTDVDITEPFKEEKTDLKMLGSLKILLVEDNDINQLVASKILEEVGAQVTIASNGAMAVKILEKDEFDVVLMDIQMPEMDGYDATYQIRNNLNLKRLPVVAMTAHAMSGDRKKCLDAGMDDYISKPIDPDLLYSKLAKYVKTDGKINLSEPIKNKKKSDYTEKGSTIELPDELPGIDIKAGLMRFMGNKKLYIELFSNFIREHQNCTEKIKNFLNAKNIEQARNYLHSIKGTAGNLSATSFHKSAASLESSIKKSSGMPGKTLLAEFESAFLETRESFKIVQKLFDGQQSKKTEDDEPESTHADMENRVKLLHEKIQLNELEAIDLFVHVRKMIKNRIPERDVNALDRAIKDFDFDGAGDMIHTIARTLNINLQERDNG